MNLQMDLLYNPLRTRPIQTGRETSMEPYPNRQFGFINNPDRQSGSGLDPTHTQTRCGGPDPLLTLLHSCLNQCLRGIHYSKKDSQDKNARTGSLLAYRAIRARLRERDIRERDIGETDIWERDVQETDIGDTVATCRFA